MAIGNHFAEHYNIQGEVQEQYQQSQANLQQAAVERVAEITMLEDVAREKYNLHQRLSKILGNLIAGLESSEKLEEIPKLPAAYVALYNGCAAEIRQALKTRQELLGEDLSSLSGLMESGAKIKKICLGSADKLSHLPIQP